MAKAAASSPRAKKPIKRKAASPKTKRPATKTAAKVTRPKTAVRKAAATKRPRKTAAVAKRAPKKTSRLAPAAVAPLAPAKPRRQLDPRLFAALCALLLFTSVVFWAILSARLQRYNADQLIDSYLFKDGATFHAASFPGAHSFLIKWPLFALMQLFGNTVTTFTVVTVLLSLATVGALTAVLYRIERRPIVFGVWCLALASILLLVPAQPSPGALLPVNLAMITTRNIEYALYLLSVYALVRSRRIKSMWFAVAAVLAGLLIASDKLFAALYVGGAGLSLVWWLGWRWKSSIITERPRAILRWLSNGIAAFIVATAVLKLITLSHLTHIVNQATTSPYTIIHSAKQLVQAIVFGIEAVFTNFGANPVQGQVVLKSVPGSLLSSFHHITIVAYLLNSLILLAVLWMSTKLFWKHRLFEAADQRTRFVLVLVWSTVAAGLVFVATNHYYPVDSRYLTIELFALTSAAALYLSQQQLRLRHAVLATLLIAVCLPIAALGCWRTYQQSVVALAQTKQLNTFIGSQIQQNGIKTIIGSYWTVTPLQTFSGRPITTIPLANCRQPLGSLFSSQWLKVPNQAVAYVSVRGSDGKYDGCSLAQLLAYYGQPSQQIVVAGSSTQPSEILWLYTDGVKHILTSPPAAGLHKPITTPVIVPPLAKTTDCDQGSLMNVVAHEDDDLLFMSPDLPQAIKAGSCVTTVYITAGDDGGGQSYAMGRQAGAEAAYSHMFGLADRWENVYATINNHEVGAAYLVGQPRVSLVFLHLPDGDLKGQGFAANNYESLNRLRTHQIRIIHGVFGLAAYTQPELIATLTALMNLYQPDQIHTQDYSTNTQDGDHSDHHAAGYFTKLAYANYETPSVLKSYAGYPGRQFPANISGRLEDEKTAAFLAYSEFDLAVCHSITDCEDTPTYGGYLARQYSIVVGHKAGDTLSTHTTTPSSKLHNSTCPSLQKDQLKSCNLKK